MNVYAFKFKLVTSKNEHDLLDFKNLPYLIRPIIIIIHFSCQIHVHTDPTADGLAPVFNNMSTTTSCPPDDAL